jgi:hypothetical protein
MSAELERRYARLLHLYPIGYRRARGDELLATLMESADDGRTRPPLREVGPLVLGALRAHAGRDRRQDARHSWLAAFRTAALMLLVYDLANQASRVALDFSHPAPPMWSPAELAVNLTAMTVGICTVIAVLRGRYRIAVVAASVGFLLTLVITWSMYERVFTSFASFPLAIVLLLPLLRHRPPPAAGLLRYAPALPLLLIVADHVIPEVFPDITGILQRGLVLAFCLGSLLWLAVDERLAMALGLLLFNGVVIQVIFMFEGEMPTLADAALGLAITGVVPAAMLLASGTAAHRRARI